MSIILFILLCDTCNMYLFDGNRILLKYILYIILVYSIYKLPQIILQLYYRICNLLMVIESSLLLYITSIKYIVYVRYSILFYTDKVGMCNVLMVIE